LFAAGAKGMGIPSSLWQSDGTATGTRQLIADPGLEKVTPFWNGSKQMVLFLRGQFKVGGRYEGTRMSDILCVTDGAQFTADLRVTSHPDPAGYNPYYKNHTSEIVSVAPRRAFFTFTASSQNKTPLLGVTDGTKAGTVQVPVSNVRGLVALNGRVIFIADDAYGFAQPWVSDGTASGTTILKDTNSSALPHQRQVGIHYSSGTGLYVASDGYAYFSGWDHVNKWSLWRTDGSPSGTMIVYQWPNLILPDSFLEDGFVSMGNRVYFSTPYLTGTLHPGWRIWESDGTSAGTRPLPGLPDGQCLGVINGELLINGTGDHRGFLYVSDGSASGTRRIDVPHGQRWNHGVVGSFGNRLMLEYYDYTHSEGGVWVTDGTTSGTYLLFTGPFTDVAVLDRRLFYAQQDAATVSKLYAMSFDGPVVEEVGSGCSEPLCHLSATALALGQSAELSGVSPAQNPGVVFLAPGLAIAQPFVPGLPRKSVSELDVFLFDGAIGNRRWTFVEVRSARACISGLVRNEADDSGCLAADAADGH
jgi:ELWxxDGT repeat protein